MNNKRKMNYPNRMGFFRFTAMTQRAQWRAIICCLTVISGGAQAVYVEKGKADDPTSWRSDEFNAQWGLGKINADQAYAAGYTGKGVKLGIFDQVVYAKHIEFFGADKITNLVTSGIREYTDPHIPVKKGDEFLYDGTMVRNAGGFVDIHGTHVAGIAAANRDGNGMHGVAYDAHIIAAETGDPGPEDGVVLGNDGGVYKAGWDALIASGVRTINNSWGIGITYNPLTKDPAFDWFTLKDAHTQFAEIKQILGTKPGGAYQGAIDAARSGIVIVFGAGNGENEDNPDAMAGLPYFVPDIASNWLSVSNMMNIFDEYTFSEISSQCGYTASFCVAAPGTMIVSSIPYTEYQLPWEPEPHEIVSGYDELTGTSMATAQVTGSVAVLMERYPYLTGAQVASVLKTTATDFGDPGIDALYGWGAINLGKAINGPGMFYTIDDIPEEFRIPGDAETAYGPTQFIADLPGTGAVLDKGKPTERVCDDVLCSLDVWSNDISGHGGLTKQGSGTLILTGNNTYSGPTLINQGGLAINGSVVSDVSVQNDGVLSGSGHIGSLTANSGGTVAPGNSVGTLHVTGDVTFGPGSRYMVEVAPGGRSDQIQSGGTVTLNGGEIAVSLENSSNLLSHSEIHSLLGQQYSILTADRGISGQFTTAVPDYLFIGTALAYQTDQVILSVNRNATTFASVAQTPNERAVAAAVEALGASNPVYESVLSADSSGQVRQAFSQLSGQVHADIASAQVNDSRYLRDTLTGRLRQAEGLLSTPDIRADDNGAWAQVLGAWDHASGNASATGYHASTGGILLGMDAALADDGRLGVATGYTRTSLKGGYGASADSDNYHLGLYGDQQFGDLVLRGGGVYSWHRFDTARSVHYGANADRETAKYNARTEQIFADAGYNVKTVCVNLEPFVNLAYINFRNNSISEGGDGAALYGNKQHTDSTVSTLGLRADTRWEGSRTAGVALRGELGWQHQYGGLERGTGLMFSNSTSPFVVNSVSASRDGAVLKASAEVEVHSNATLSLGYGGLLSENYQDNSVNAGLTWRF